MQKFMCNVCGILHDTFNDAALCHPDVATKEIDGTAGAHGPTLREAERSKQGGAWYCWKCRRVHNGDEELTC